MHVAAPSESNSRVAASHQLRSEQLQRLRFELGQHPWLESGHSIYWRQFRVYCQKVSGWAFLSEVFEMNVFRKQLINVGYPETDTRQLSKISIVVRNDATWYNGRLSSLAEKRACIPEYGGKGEHINSFGDFNIGYVLPIVSLRMSMGLYLLSEHGLDILVFAFYSVTNFFDLFIRRSTFKCPNRTIRQKKIKNCSLPTLKTDA